MDIGSLYTDYYSKQVSDAKTNKMSSSLKNRDMTGASEEELMEVCKDFESYFVEQIVKQAVETFTSGDEMSSGSMSTLQGYYKDSLVKEYAEKMTDNQDFGLAKTLFEQMKRNYGFDSVKPSEVLAMDEEKPISNTEVDDTSAVETASTLLSDEQQ